MADRTFARLTADIRACTLCAEHLPLGPRPVIQVDPDARILVVGQAPGTRVHQTGIPFNDPSGDRLRAWMGIDNDTFYDPKRIALVPMGFCYPGSVQGKGRGGDLPPRPECAETWRTPLLAHLNRIELTLVIGRYAIDWHLSPPRGASLTEVVKDWETRWPDVVPLPHPSPRNIRWFKNNPWLETDLLPALRQRVADILS